jgi:hypothetical protein
MYELRIVARQGFINSKAGIRHPYLITLILVELYDVFPVP